MCLCRYEPEFVGMVPDPGDGVGVWRCTADVGMSVICNANTLTLETLIDLCEGTYGEGPTRPDHVVVAVNCSWTTGADVGQFWQRCASSICTRYLQAHPACALEGIGSIPTNTGFDFKLGSITPFCLQGI